MKRIFRSALALLLAIVMTVGALPLSVFAYGDGGEGGEVPLVIFPETPENESVWSYDAIDETSVKITGYSGERTAVVVPATLGGKAVTEIGDYAFYWKNSLQGVRIPEGVTRIGYQAFYYCTALTAVELPSTLTTIGGYAFDYCNSLTSIDLPAGLKTIEYDAFYNCNKLTGVTLPAGLETIGNNAFSGCSALTGITLPASLTNVGDGVFMYCTGLKSFDLGSLTAVPVAMFYGCSGLETVTFSPAITEIRREAFYNCSSLKSVTFTDNVTVIGQSAFAYCKALESVTLPAYLTTLGGYAFDHCSALTSIALPGTLTSVGEYVFQYCSKLTSFTCGSNMTSIPNGMFAYTGITTLVLPEFITRIGNYAFRGCKSLSSVTYEGEITAIGSYAFDGCTGLTSFVIPATVTEFGEYVFANSGLTSVILPENVKKVPYAMFNGCADLTQVTLAEGTTEIANYAFSGCSSLTEIALTPTLEKIGSNAFRSSGLTSITFPAGLKTIEGSAFSDCDSLTSVTLPNNLESFGDNVFYDCDALTAVDLGTALTVLPGSTFRHCDSLESVSLPTITEIGSYAFQNCKALESVTFGTALESIGYAAFQYCEGLTGVTFPASLKTIDSYAFSNTGLVTVEIPEGVTRLEQASFAFNPHLTSITLPANLEYVGPYALEDDTALTTLVIPDSVTRIEYDAFEGCTALTTLTLPAGLESISNDAISGCNALTNLSIADSNEHYSCQGNCLIDKQNKTLLTFLPNSVIPDDGTVENIGEYAINSISGMTELVIPEGIKSIEDYGVYSYDIKTITLPSTIESLGYYAINTSNLKAVLYNGTQEMWNAIDGLNSNNYLTRSNTLRIFKDDITSIALTSAPAKTAYFVGETLSTDGMAVTLTYKDNSTVDLTNAVSLSDVDMTTAGEKTVTVSFFDLWTDTFTVTVENYPEIAVDETKDALINNGGERAYFSFTPTVTGNYAFTSSARMDTYGQIFDLQMNELAYDDDSAGSSQFRVTYRMEAGTTYLLCARYYDSSMAGAIPVTVTKLPDVTGITLDKESYTGYMGTGFNLYTTQTPSEALVEPVEWTSSDESVATVSNYGYVKLVGDGTANITATTRDTRLVAACAVTSVQPPVLTEEDPVTVTITNNDQEMMWFTPTEDGTYRFYGYDYDKEGFIACFYVETKEGWSVSYTTGTSYTDAVLEAGERYSVYTNFNSYTSPGNGAYTVKVGKTVPATAIVLDRTSYEGYPHNSFTLNYSFEPWNGTAEDVEWSTTDMGIASVSYGYVVLQSVGEATITATSENGLTATCAVTVKDFETIALNETKDVEITENNGRVYYRFTPATNGVYVFETSDNSRKYMYAAVLDGEDFTELDSVNYNASNRNARVSHKLSAGTSYVFTAGFNDYYDTGSFKVTLTQKTPAAGMTVKGNDTAYSGFSGSYYVEFAPKDCAEEDVTWSSSNEAVATINEYGYAAFLAAGSVTFTATSENGLTASLTVTVKDPVVLTENVPSAANITKQAGEEYPYGAVCFVFTPATAGNYVFAVRDVSNDNEIYVTAETDERYFSSDSGKLTADLTAGMTCRIMTSICSYHEGEDVTDFTLTAAKEVAPTAVVIDQGDAMTGYAYDTRLISWHFEPWNAREEDVTVFSSNESAVRADYSELTLVAPGTAVVTVQAGDLSDTVSVTVKDFDPITAGVPATATVAEPGAGAYFRFTAPLDGDYKFYSTGAFDTYGELFDAGMVPQAENDDGPDRNFSMTREMNAGDQIVLKARLYDSSMTGSFVVRVDRVKHAASVAVKTMPRQSRYVTGHVMEALNYYGLTLTVTWDDGSTTDWHYTGNTWQVGDTFVNLQESKDIETTGLVTATVEDASVDLTFTVISDPVDRLEVVEPSQYQYVMNTEGEWRTGPDSSSWYFYGNWDNLNDAKVKVYFKDGTSKTADLDGDLNGYWVEMLDTQTKDHWTVGSDNVITFSYLGHTADMNVTVVENPVDHLEAPKGSVITVMERVNGYLHWSSENWIYNLTDAAVANALVTIVYTDGTRKTAKIWDEVDGYYVNSDSSDQNVKPWTVGGENYATATYLGKEVRIPVTVAPNPLKSITVTDSPTREYVYGDPAYGDDYGYGYNLWPRDLTGLVFVAEYTDGTRETLYGADADTTRLTIACKAGEFEYRVYLKGSTPESGKAGVAFEWLGQSATYEVNVVPSPVSGLTVTALPTLTSVEEYYEPNWDGLSFTVAPVKGAPYTVTVTDSASHYDYTEDQGLTFSFAAGPYTGWIGSRNGVYVLNVAGCECEIEGMEETFGTVAEVELSKYTPGSTGATATLTHDDGSVETVQLNNLAYSFEPVDPSSSSYYAYGYMTPKGLLPMSVYSKSSGSGMIAYLYGRGVPLEAGGVTYTWSEDYKTCTAEEEDGDKETVNTTTSQVKATCTAAGTTTYTATFTNAKFATQTKTVKTGAALGHSWGAASYVWSEDNTTCTATRVCARDNSHKEEETAPAQRSDNPATCEAANVTYTAIFANPAFDTQVKKTAESGEALGHNWGDPDYTWSENNATCTAARVCGRDASHVEREVTRTEYTVTRQPTAEGPGVVTYTATFTNPAFAEQTRTVEVRFVWGDANGDNKVDNKDIVRLKNYLANLDEDTGISSNGTTTYEIFLGADANGDGVKNNKDIVRLKNYLMNFDEETGESFDGTKFYTLGPEA